MVRADPVGGVKSGTTGLETAGGASACALSSWCGTIPADAADGGLVPAALVAVTVSVYAVPFVRPSTTMGLPVPLALAPPGVAVAV